MNDLKLIVLDNIQELGEKVNQSLKEKRKTNQDFFLPITRNRFGNGEGKVKINDTVREKDVYILSDVGNYDLTYTMHNHTVFMSPDEHFQDIKRVISAIHGSASKITLIIPLLYQARQHKRKGKESLDCAFSLKKLQTLGVHHIVTFDAHDSNVSNAIPNLPFENFYVAYDILDKIIEQEEIKNLLVISPDMGAMERARYYAEILHCDVGVFYKRRDLSKVVNGKNPILEHVYLKTEVQGKDILVVDDMIASGGSMIEVAKDLKQKGANCIYLISTFALFTEGITQIEEAYQNGFFNKIYSTNLSYVPKEIKQKEWFDEVDCSKRVADIIHALHEKESLKPLFDLKKDMGLKIKEKQKRREL